jgi:hypothetical protein
MPFFCSIPPQTPNPGVAWIVFMKQIDVLAVEIFSKSHTMIELLWSKSSPYPQGVSG